METINKHSIKIQIGVAVVVLITVFMWGVQVSGYAKDVESNTRRIEKVESKLDSLATKEDLQTLKQDIKDFIK